MKRLLCALVLLTAATMFGDGEIYFAYGTDARPLAETTTAGAGRWIDWRGVKQGSLYFVGTDSSAGTFVIEGSPDATVGSEAQIGPDAGSSYTISDATPLAISTAMTSWIRVNTLTLSAGTASFKFVRDATK